MAGEQVPVPTQHGLGPDQQPDPAQHAAGQPMHQGGEEGALGRGEPDLPAVQLALQDADLVTESEDLGVLGAVAHGQQPQHRQRVRHTEVRQSQQHSRTSWPSDRQRSAATSKAGCDKIPSWSSEWP